MNFCKVFMVKKLFLGAFNVHRISALTCGSKSILSCDAALFVSSQSYGAPNPFLSPVGQNIRNNYGQGDIVPLRGVNLGSWLLMEGWMLSMDSPAWLIITP